MMRAETKKLLKRATMAATGKRGKNYGTLLLLAFATAFLSVLMVQKLRERRVLGLLVQEQQHQLFTLQLHLQKEMEQSKEMKNRLEELRSKTISLANQKTELTSKIMETKTIILNLETKKTEMEAALKEKENQINGITEKATGSSVVNQDHQVTTLIQLLNQKEAEIDEMKRQLRLIEHNPAENSNVMNIKEKYEKSQDAPQETSKHHDYEEPLEKRVGNVDEEAIEHEKILKARKRVQIEEQDEQENEIEGSKDRTTADNEKLEFSSKSQLDEALIAETKEHEDVENAELAGDTADNKTAIREEEETQANNGETEKPDNSLEKTAINEGEEAQANKGRESEELNNSPSWIDANFTEITDSAKMKSRQGETTERSSRSRFIQESERDQEHKTDSEEEKGTESAELISYSDDSQILKSRQPEMSETSSRSKFFQESGEDKQPKIDSEEEKDVKNVELISLTNDSQNTKLEANERQFTKDAESEKIHYLSLADSEKVHADAIYGERTDRASLKTRLARRIRRRSRRQHLLKTETSQVDNSGMNRRNTRSSKVKVDNSISTTTERNQPQTSTDGSGRSRMENKEVRELPLTHERNLKGLMVPRIITLPKKYFSETADRIINKRARVSTATK